MRLQILNFFLLSSCIAYCQDQEQDNLEQQDEIAMLAHNDEFESELDSLIETKENDLLLDRSQADQLNSDLQNQEPQDDDLQAQEQALQNDIYSQMPTTLDTLGFDDSGNWVEKRVYWERAEHAFGKILILNQQITQLQVQYFGVRNDIDKTLDAGKCALGISVDDINKVITYLIGILEQNGDRKNSFHDTVLENKDKLLALSSDLQMLAKFDSDMDQVIIKLIDQAKLCNEYEAKAWADFKQIGRILNDESAKELYYQVANYRKNIKLVLNYLKKDLKKTFDVLVLKANNKFAEIKKNISELNDSGINLTYELKAINDDLNYRADQSRDGYESQVEAQPKKNKKPTVWGSILSSLSWIWNLILWLPRKILGLFGN